MPDFTFRRACEGDVPEICRIRLAVTENRLSDPRRVPPELVREYLLERGRGWVCARGDRLLGFSIGDLRSKSIWALFVEPGAEDLGIGSRLLELAVAWLRSEGVRLISLSTQPGTRAERFYRARGWLVEGWCANGDLKLVLPVAGQDA